MRYDYKNFELNHLQKFQDYYCCYCYYYGDYYFSEGDLLKNQISFRIPDLACLEFLHLVNSKCFDYYKKHY